MSSYDEPISDVPGGMTPNDPPVPRDALEDVPDAALGAGYLPTAAGTTHRSVYPPIDDYAFLSDCETNCLIARNGSVEWLCIPRPDSPSVFGAMLDRSAGHFRLGPYGVNVPAARRYLPGGMIVETTWQTETGWLIVRDALVLGPWHNNDKRSGTYRRTPRDWDAEHILLRTVKCVNGVVELELTCEPSFDYHRGLADWQYTGDVYEQATASCSGRPESPTLTLTTDMRLGLEGRSAQARTRMQEGDEVFVALSWSPLPPPRTFAEAAQKMWATTEYWRQWITLGKFPDHEWRGYLQRSALTLKGLTYAPTGALLAAATTSLPETPGGERNWDYRYSWVRDSTFALWGLYTLGLNREADDFFAFLYDVAKCDDGETLPLQVLYGIGGERQIEEYELDHLHGYDGARPVRIGNDAYQQDQHDIWGTILDSVYLHVKSRQQVPESLWPILEKQVQAAIEHWRNPDRSMWEVRGEPQHFTSSKVMCWVALDRGAKLAEMHGEYDYARKWHDIADEIRADILDNGVNADGVFTQTYGGDTLDASLLLVPLLRFLPPDDHRVRKTVLAIADDLTEQGLVLRYRTESTDDGLSGVEGTFTICSFWLVSALVEIGEVQRARHLLERLLGYSSPLKLYAEEIDPRSGRHLGNFPQAFTHLALINAVMHVIRAEESVRAGDFHPAHRSGGI
ncbi:glycoside hydrolase family 15 protein [Nocardia mexicana]|uniref:Trehalase n=1 Tax=Nocardia mexicana TaxID=279262 RepID=A0A370HCN0_9NOCA|nr:glycoside hydrolase family 15 protein [Nocardia mexicana]RDI54241.1 GH15 family glucan-1,4-alpha-glucosidase [Nocardia mexicana]